MTIQDLQDYIQRYKERSERDMNKYKDNKGLLNYFEGHVNCAEHIMDMLRLVDKRAA